MPTFEPGQVVTVFRSRLRDDAEPGYHDTADRMEELAREMPGFVDYKFFHADDGERVSLVTFADAESQQAWRTHVEHRAAQAQGRAGWYASYSLQVASTTRAHQYEHTFD